MRTAFAFFLLCFITAGCGSSGISKQLSVADSLVITFNYNSTDSVINSVHTTDKKAIQKLAGFVGKGDSTAYRHCGYSGNMQFYREGKQLLPVVFNYTDNCRYFLYDWENKVTSTRMNNEAADFLRSLAEGKNWY